MDELHELRHVFREDAAESLAGIEQLLLSLSTDSPMEDIHCLYRYVHSLKGGAGTFGYAEAAGIAHRFEAVLSGMRCGTTPVSDPLVTLLLEARDALQLALSDREATHDHAALFAALETYQDEGEAAPLPSSNSSSLQSAPTRTVEILLHPKRQMFLQGSDPLRLIRQIAAFGPLSVSGDDSALPPLEALDCDECHLSWRTEVKTSASLSEIQSIFFFAEEDCDSVIRELPAPAPTATTPEPAGTRIHLDAAKIDELLRLTGEVLSAQGAMAQELNALDLPRHSALHLAQRQLRFHLQHLQEAVVGMRMQPVQPLFARFPRLVREIGKQLGKSVELVLEGSMLELDRLLVEKLSDPVTHLIRNAMDHGIETPAEREAAGKPATARLSLSARHGGGRALITVSDDGRGIDRARLLEKMRGLIGAEADRVPPEQRDHWIFTPGLSTKSEVTDLSGRGVGLDAVKASLQALGGTVSIENRPGLGLSIILSLPLTLALAEGILFDQGGERYLLPLTAVQKIQPLPPLLADGACSRVFHLANASIPLCPLQENGANDGSIAIFVQAEGQQRVLLADHVVGVETVMFHILGLPIAEMNHFSGAGQLADGTIAFVIDANALMHRPSIGTYLREVEPCSPV